MSDSLPRQKKLIPVSEAAKILGVSIDTVRRWDKSGLLHSDRPDGKNRYFSLQELRVFQSSQPLSISQAARELGLSSVTLRRLEAKGLIKAKRNTAGVRVYDRDSLKKFSNSDYYLRKMHVKNKLSEAVAEENKPTEEIVTESKTDLSKESDLTKSIDTTADTTIPKMPAQPSEEIDSAPNLRPLQRMPEFLATIMVFLLLFAFGIRNVTVSREDTSFSASISSVLSFAETMFPGFTSTSAVLSATEDETSSPSSSSAVSPITTYSAYLTPKDVEATSKTIVTVKIKNRVESVNIRRKPMITSEIIGSAKDDDIFEFVSIDSGWYEVKLIDSSTGYISSAYVQKGEENK